MHAHSNYSLCLNLNLVRSSLALFPVHILRHDMVAQCRRVSSSLRSFSCSISLSGREKVDQCRKVDDGDSRLIATFARRPPLDLVCVVTKRHSREKSSRTGKKIGLSRARQANKNLNFLQKISRQLGRPSRTSSLFSNYPPMLLSCFALSAFRSLCSPFVRREFCFFFACEVLLHFLVQHSRPRRGIYSGPVAP